MILELHHIQLAMPEGRERDARIFYGGVLGLREVDKPEELRSRGGVWFEGGSIKLHLGVEAPFSRTESPSGFQGGESEPGNCRASVTWSQCPA